MALPERKSPGWLARLELEYYRSGGRTVLGRRRHVGPLLVQRPFYPQGPGCCHSYLIHPPGGVVGGDRIELNVRVGANAHALITTPAAGKFYRSDGEIALQAQQLQVASGALLEWLPQETILFEGAQVESTTRVELEGDARFVGWEILCLGRPASGEGFDNGALRQRVEVWLDGEPLLIERSQWLGGSEPQRAHWGLGDQPVFATMVATGDFGDELEGLREGISGARGEFALSQLPGLLVARYLGEDALEARQGFTGIWQRLRPLMGEAMQGDERAVPRIWNT